jgi:cytochrome c-type biogenesis protein CcmH
MKRPLELWILLTLGLALSATLRVEAQEGGGFPTDNDVNEVAKKLYCPVCPNTPLDVCETKACQDWRAQIRDQLAAGWSERAILDYFVAQYGERVLAEPQRGGFTSLVWILPVIAAVGGLGAVIEVVRRWKGSPSRAGPPSSPTPAALPEMDPVVLARIEKELEKIT